MLAAVKGSAGNLGGGNVIAIMDSNPTGVANAEYFFIKYKASAGTTIDIYLNAKNDGDDAWNLLSQNSGLFISDGEWHVLVYDCIGTQADVFKIYFNTTSEDGDAPVLEIAYVGFVSIAR